MIGNHVAGPGLQWFVRTTADRDTHRGVLGDDGKVQAQCGEVFRPLKPLVNRGPALPGEPPDPDQVCLSCCKVVSPCRGELGELEGDRAGAALSGLRPDLPRDYSRQINLAQERRVGVAALADLRRVPRDRPTEREHVTALYELCEPDIGGFGWGYHSTGTSHAAAAILADALNVNDARFAVGSDEDETDHQLREDFCEDVLSQMCEEWRLRRGVVLRWARGWYAEHQITEVPEAVATLPPIRIDPQARPR